MSSPMRTRFTGNPRVDVSSAEASNLRWHWLYEVGAVAAVVISALFLIGIVDVVIAGGQPTIRHAWLAPFQNNWLVVLFKLNAGLGGAQPGSLSVLSLLDLAIMALFCAVFLALHLALRRTSAAWSLVAASLPFLGIPVFLITGMAGRSALLLAGLIISVVMLRANTFAKATAYAGILASALLLFGGDLGTAIFSSSRIIAVLVGIGYVLWVIWFGVVARRLFQLGQEVARAGAKEKGWSISAARVTAAAYGVFGGLLGCEHGYFETLQGNVATSSVAISAIGPPCQADTAWHGCEPAITIIPNFLITGIFAIAISLTIMVWATTMVQRQHGGVVLMMLGVVLLLVGGGFTPTPFVLIAGLAGTGTKTPPAWWRASIAAGAQPTLARLWLWMLLASVAWYVGLEVVGAVFNQTVTLLGALGLVLGLMAVVTGFAHDIQRQTELERTPSMSG